MARSPLRPSEIAYYEGLIHKTASMCAPRVQEEYEDIVAIFRIKVWRALEAYDPSRSTVPVRRYVFSCVKNQEKDLLKRKRRNEVSLDAMIGLDDELAHDSFECAYLAVSVEVTYAEVERELPLLPSTLSSREREVLLCLYTGLSQRETAVRLVLRVTDVERAVKGIRSKMADWRPGAVTIPNDVNAPPAAIAAAA
jgi:RNA polymerase sigma factor (sigma-70 family)